MARSPAHRPPQQARSRASLRRLLDAADTVLARHGLDGATLPRIAKQARLSPASVYRRFRDKDALMAAVFARFSDANEGELAKPVDHEAIRAMGIRAFTRMWIAGMIAGYRAQTGLMRAAVAYSQRHATSAAVRRKEALELQSAKRLTEILLLWRNDIRHPNPEYAVNYAMVTVAFTLRELILFDQISLFEKVVPLGDEHLREELPRMVLRYLGVDEP
jgi:AcrR family transcriptional regulator